MNKLRRYYNQNRGFIIMFIIVIALIIIIIQVLNSLVEKDKQANKEANVQNRSNNTAIVRKGYQCNNRREGKKSRVR